MGSAVRASFGNLPTGELFESFFEHDLPCHMFDVKRVVAETPNDANWHVAHIFDVKDGNTDWHTWSKDDLTKRMVRNVHPCNYCLLPQTDWQRLGADKTLLAYFVYRYRQIYEAVFDDFISLAGVRAPGLENSSLPRMRYGEENIGPGADHPVSKRAKVQRPEETVAQSESGAARHFQVNQTEKVEFDRKYLCAPRNNRAGHQLLELLRPGDIIHHYSSRLQHRFARSHVVPLNVAKMQELANANVTKLSEACVTYSGNHVTFHDLDSGGYLLVLVEPFEQERRGPNFFPGRQIYAKEIPDAFLIDESDEL